MLGFLVTLLYSIKLGSSPLFDWDEINFAEAAREMWVTGKYSLVQIDFRPFIEKPPFFFWLQALSYHFFGVNEFAARFPNALCGGLTFALLAYLGQSMRLGFLWALLMAASFLPHFYFQSGIIDPWFNFFMYLACLAFWRFRSTGQYIWPITAALAAGLATLTKGPVGLLLPSLIGFTYFGFERLLDRSFKFPFKATALYLALALFFSSAWYVFDFSYNLGGTFSEFWKYQLRLFKSQDAGHGGPFYYHFIVLFFGCFPASLFFLLPKFASSVDVGVDLTPEKTAFTRLQWHCLFWVLLIFSIVQTKIIHYSSFAYLPLTALAAIRLQPWLKRAQPLTLGRKLTALLQITVASVFVIALPLISKFPEKFLFLFKTPLAVACATQVHSFQGTEAFLGVAFFIMIVGVLFYHSTRKISSRFFTYVLLLTSFFIISVFTADFLPKIERHTQGGAREIYQSHAGQDHWVQNFAFKSFAPLFYSAREVATSQQGPTRLPRYWVSRITDRERMKLEKPTATLVTQKGCFLEWVEQ